MISELGHYALVLAIAVAIIQSTVPFWGARTGDSRLMALARPAAVTQFLLVGIAFAALMHAYIVSDFSVANVYENSHTAKPMLYKITGVWGNHEGSMLLWVLILTLFGGLVAVFGRNLPEKLRALVLSVQGWIGVSFIGFILFTSNPFERLSPAPIEGMDLNPVLQDIGLAVHPPLLYLGYVGCSIAFAFAVAALIDGKIEAAWARWVRPWTLVSWLFLTLGIAMGSYWAYYELGWGGWWFWDPVENSSFMPWLAATALLHSAIVMEKRDALKIWTVLLAILTFSLSLLGTFLVRSGVLTSVHTFAADPGRGLWILTILILFIGGALTLFAGRSSSLTKGGLFAPISREGSLILNNLFLTVGCAIVLFGTLYPLIGQVIGSEVNFGAPFYNVTFVPLMVPLLLAVPFGPLLAWKRGDFYAVTQRLYAAAGLAIAAMVIVAISAGLDSFVAAFGVGLAVWLIAGALSELVFRAQFFKVGFGTALRRLAGLPRSAWGMALGHLGLGVTVLGIVVSSVWSTEAIKDIRPGESVEIGSTTVTLAGYEHEENGNFVSTLVHFTISRNGEVIRTSSGEKRGYMVRGQETTEASINWFGPSHLYISPGDIRENGVVLLPGEFSDQSLLTVHVYWKPLVAFVWLGAVIMAFGGALSLSDRRLRVGAPKTARHKTLQPAE
ncbi:MAG: heme lyase CcmF/NrfE family subunit [Bauldia sp.]|nr:heme lyase CcmF/NrfE family subunit [Bauldia sp.]